MEKTVPGDELSVGQERRGNRVAEHSPQAQLDLAITANVCPRLCHKHTFELMFCSQNPLRWVLLLSPISGEEREAQRG